MENIKIKHCRAKYGYVVKKNVWKKKRDCVRKINYDDDSYKIIKAKNVVQFETDLCSVFEKCNISEKYDITE